MCMICVIVTSLSQLPWHVGWTDLFLGGIVCSQFFHHTFKLAHLLACLFVSGFHGRTDWPALSYMLFPFLFALFPSTSTTEIRAFCHVSWDQTRIQAPFLNMLTFDHNLNQHSRRLFWYLYFAPSLFVILAFVKMFSKLSRICDHERRLRKATISVSESITTKLPQPYPLKQNRWLHYGRKLH